MTDYACTEQRFLNDIKDHVMSVIYDDGLNRHLHFAKPGSSCYHFHIVTFCGYLVMTGDSGSWILSRLKDNFDFIRHERHGQDGLCINPQYWSEKIVAVDKHSGIEKYSSKRFDKLIRERFDSLTEDGDVDRVLLAHMRYHAEELLLGCCDHYEEATRSLDEFNDEYEDRLGFAFLDELWDHDLTDYTHGFVWACWAMAFAVRTYDAYKAERALVSTP